MRFTNIRDLRYSSQDKSTIDLLATCSEYGEIPMTLNIVNTEDIHTFVKPDGSEVLLEQYCKTQYIAPYVEPEPEPILELIPQVITIRQARLQLLKIGLLDDVDALVALDRKSQIEWEYANDIERNSPLVSTLCEQLGLTKEQLDNLFVEASKL